MNAQVRVFGDAHGSDVFARVSRHRGECNYNFILGINPLAYNVV